jgi:hypothetical protein
MTFFVYGTSRTETDPADRPHAGRHITPGHTAMKTRRSPHLLTATALAASLMLAACGGGSGEAPPAAPGAAVDTTGPVVTITDSVADTTASGPVTFTFAFNEDVGTSFTADDVTVTGGTKGAFTRVNGTSATLVVTPTPNSTGTILVSVAASGALDAKGNGNAATSSQQAFETVVRTQMALPVSFDVANVGYGLAGFGGAEDSSIVADPTNAANKVAKVVRAAGAETFAGTTITDTRAGVQTGLSPKIPFNATDTRMSVRVWSPDAGIPVRLKVEDSADPNKSVETEATVTTAAGWQTLTFNFSNNVAGTPALNLGNNYNKATIFFDFGRAKAAAVQKTYYFDDITFVPGAAGGGGGGATGTTLASFDEATALAFDGFDGGTATVDAAPPAGGGTGKALKIFRSGGQVWAGAKVNVGVIPLTSTNRTLSARVYSPTAGRPIVLKLENLTDAGVNTGDIQATEAVVAGWQTLTWVVPAAKVGPQYSWAVMLPNLGTLASVSPGETYYFDDLKLATAPVTTGTALASFDEALALPFAGFDGGEGTIDAAPPAGGSGKALKIFRSGGQVWAGAKVNVGVIPLTTTDRTISARVYSPAAGRPIVMKLENLTDAGTNTGDIQATEAVVAGWQTLTWVVPAGKVGPQYSWAVMLPNLGTLASVSPGETYYFDDIRSSAAAAPGGGGGGGGAIGAEMGSGGPQTLTVATGDVKTGDGGNTMFVAGEGIFAVNVVGSAETTPPFNLAGWPNARTANFGSITGISGGSIGYFQDDVNLSNSTQKVDEGGWVAGTALSPNGVPNFFRYFVLKGPVSNAAYMGLYMNAPNNGTVNVSSFSKLKMKVWGPGPMFERTNLNPVLQVTLVGPKVAGCTTGSGGSEITQNLTANLKNGAGGFYTMPLSGFAVGTLCGTDTNAASVLAKVARVVVTVPGASFNFTNLDGGNYATGLNLGPVGFTNN